MGLLRKFQQTFSRASLLRTWLGNTDTICDRVYNSAFYDKLEFLQCNACLTITGAVRGTSIKKTIP